MFEKKKNGYGERVGWSNILNINRDFLDGNPYAEIVLSDISDDVNMGRKSQWIKCLIKIISYPFLSVMNSIVSNYRRNAKKYKGQGIIISYLDRENDWGLIWPVVKELENRNMNYFLFITDEIYINHGRELNELKNASIMSTKRLSNKRYIKLEICDIRDAFSDMKKIKKLIKEYNLGNYVDYVSRFLTYRAFSNGLYSRFFKDCKYSYSLGNRIFGFLYHDFGIKHYAMQHGEYSEEGLKVWSSHTKANQYVVFTYGAFYERLLRSVYGTKAVSVGSLLTRKEYGSVEKNYIVYFTDAAGIVSNKKYDLEVKKSLDEFIELYDRYNGKYQFYLKIHPNDDEDYFRSYNKMFGKEIGIFDRGLSAMDVLKSTFICISLGSTVNLQAVRMNCVSVQLKRNWDVFGDQAFSLVVNNLTEIDRIIDIPSFCDEVKKKQHEILEQYDKDIENPEKLIATILLKDSMDSK